MSRDSYVDRDLDHPMADLHTAHYLQRLVSPGMNPFSFGAGGGGISAEAKELLSNLFWFDYMGAAEYEFGAVPSALAFAYNMSSAGHFAA